MVISLETAFVSAQGGTCLFSEPLLLFEDLSVASDGAGPIGMPVILSDAESMVHVFWEYTELALDSSGNTRSIYYMRRDSRGVWSSPVDVLVSPNTSLANGITAEVDNQGFLYVLWHGKGKMFYSWASVHEATNPHAWIPPKTLPVDARFYPPAAVRFDSQGILHVVFAEMGKNLHHIQSSDKGVSWSTPVQISAVDFKQSTSDPSLWVSESDTLYVVWTQLQLPAGYPPTGVFFSRSIDGGASWSDPLQIAGMDDGEASLAQGANGQLSVVYHGRVGVGGAFHRFSNDEGASWSAPIELVPRGQGGMTGAPGMDVDSAGNVHMVIAQDYPNLWYGEWNGATWSRLFDLSTLLSRPPQGYTEHPKLAVGLGNQLHAVFFDSGKRLWYTTCQTSADPLPVRQYVSEILATELPTQTPTATSTSLPIIVDLAADVDNLEPPLQTNVNVLIWTLIPPVLLSAIVVFATIFRRHSVR